MTAFKTTISFISGWAADRGLHGLRRMVADHRLELALRRSLGTARALAEELKSNVTEAGRSAKERVAGPLEEIQKAFSEARARGDRETLPQFLESLGARITGLEHEYEIQGKRARSLRSKVTRAWKDDKDPLVHVTALTQVAIDRAATFEELQQTLVLRKNVQELLEKEQEHEAA